MARHPQPFYRTARAAWFVQVGKRQINLGPDKKAAFQEYHRLMAAEGIVAVAPGKLAIHDLADLFLDHIQRHKATATYEWYKHFLVEFDKAHGRKPARDLKPHHLETWLDSKEGWGPSTRRGAITAVKRLFAWAKQGGRIDANPLADVRRPKMGRRVVMDDDGAAAFFAALEPGPLLDFATAMIETGCRPGELSRVEAATIDLGRSLMVVTGKTGARDVMLTAKAKELIGRLMAGRPTGSVFLSPRGKPWNNNSLRCAFRRLRARTGIKGAVPYALRHLFGSRAIERGVDSLVVAKLMGHSDVSMLQEHYVHHRAEALRIAAEKATGGAAGGGGTPP